MPRRIRVVQMICGFVVGDLGGGAELFGIRLAEALQRLDFEVAICNLWHYALSVERSWHTTVTAQGIPVRYHAAYRHQFQLDSLTAILGSYRPLRELQPDIINTHVEFADTVGVALRLSGYRGILVRTGHVEREWTFAPLRGKLISPFYPLVNDCEVAVSRQIAAQLDRRPLARLLDKRAHYIPNAVDGDVVLARRTQRNLRAQLGISESTALFGSVGRLAEQKGFDLLIRAFAQVQRQLPTARLLLVGKGDLREQLEALAQSLGLAEAVIFTGPRTDAIDLIGALDVFVSSSRWEGLPTVIMEAMHLGVPVVATAVSGSPDLVLDGQTGLLVAPGDLQALAGAMLRQYTQREQAQAMAVAARKHVEHFSMRSTAAQYAELYHSLAQRRGLEL